MPYRSLSGESVVQASQILLKQDALKATGIQSRLIDVYELILLASAIETVLFNRDADSPATQKVMGAYIAAQLSQYRRLDVPVPLAEVDGLFSYLATYRLISTFFFQEVRCQDAPGVFLDLKTKINNLTPSREAQTVIQQDHTHFYAPQKQVRVRKVTQNHLQLDTHVMFSPQQVVRKRIDTHTLLQ